jgi:hypothetical protein
MIAIVRHRRHDGARPSTESWERLVSWKCASGGNLPLAEKQWATNRAHAFGGNSEKNLQVYLGRDGGNAMAI